MGKKHKKHHKHDRNDLEEEREKPLKLVLKVSTPDPRDNDSYDETPERKHKHKKKKKHKKYDQEQPDRKRKRERDVAPASEDEDMGTPSKKAHTEDRKPIAPPQPQLPPTQPQQLPEQPRVVKEITLSERNEAFAKTLDYLHKMLQRKDQNGFFAFPVTDAIAPLYSTIIKQPMDFTTMRQKIEEGEYQNFVDFRSDFKVMCDNAMTYNHPETIYYKEAQKLQSIGLKQMTKERMIGLRRTVAFMADLYPEDLNQLDDGVPEVITLEGDVLDSPATLTKKPKKPKPSKFEAIPDRMSPEAILAQARAAAKDAADSLTLRKPHTEYGFLRRRTDGSTSITVLNTDNDGRVSNKEKILNLGQLIGRVQAGSGVLTGLREDKRNKANPVSYLNYGPYATYAPIYDTTTANVSKEESDLLLATYGDDTGVEYCKSLRTFVGDSGDYAVKMVDSLLDILTQGEHSRAIQYVLEREKREQPQNKQTKDSTESLKNNIDFSALRSLTDIGIDVSFVDHFEKELVPKEVSAGSSQTDAIQKKLDETGEMLNDLQKTQHQRLSQKLPPHLAMLPGPSEKETKLAEKVTKELTELAKRAQPQAIVPAPALRQALGVSSAPDTKTTTQQANLGQSQPSVQTNQSQSMIQSSGSQSQPLLQNTQAAVVGSSVGSGAEEAVTKVEAKEEALEQEVMEASQEKLMEADGGEEVNGDKESAADKDSMDQDLDDVLDELEMEGDEEESEGEVDEEEEEGSEEGSE